MVIYEVRIPMLPNECQVRFTPITSDSINILANQYCVLQPNDKLRASQLIDTLVYVDETDSILNGYSAYNQRLNKIGHNAFTEINRKSIKNKIAILYVDGAIGESNNEINAKSVSRICKELELNNAIKAIAQGRIWSGEDALKIGLVDELGGLYDAVKVAALSANINTYQLVVASTKSKSNKLGQISIEQKIEENILKNKLGDYYQLFKELNEIQQRDKIQARLLFDFNDL